MISSPKPLTDIPLRSAYTDLNCISAESSNEPQNGEHTGQRETWEFLNLSHMIDNGKMTACSVQLLYKHTRAEITPGLFRKRCLRAEQSRAKNGIHPVRGKDESSSGTASSDRAKTNRKIRADVLSQTPVITQFI